jgi:hypothetical protein
MNKDMKLLGRAERIDFPDLGLSNQMSKIDTGAYTSSIDCESTEVVDRNGKQVLEVVLLRPEREGYTGNKLVIEDFDRTEIKNSNGAQERFIIFANVVINGETLRGRFSLADRSILRYPVLIGRKLLHEGRFVVDVRQGQGYPDDEEERGL